MLTTVLTLTAYAALTAFGCWYGVKVLDVSLDYPSPLWKVRYRAADRAGRGKIILVGDEQHPVADYLNGALQMAQNAPLTDATQIMDQAYWEVARVSPAFKRWICPLCLAIYVAVWCSIAVSLIIVPLYGAWTLVYFLSVQPFIGLLARL